MHMITLTTKMLSKLVAMSARVGLHRADNCDVLFMRMENFARCVMWANPPNGRARAGQPRSSTCLEIDSQIAPNIHDESRGARSVRWGQLAVFNCETIRLARRAPWLCASFTKL